MNFELTGNLLVKENTVDVNATFKKREFVIEVPNERNKDWNDFIKFQLTQDKCSTLDAFNVGEPIRVFFNIKGRKWEKDGKVNYFSNLEAWKLEKVQSSGTPDTSLPQYNEIEIPPAGPDDDLPF